jgi:hypothetical protein
MTTKQRTLVGKISSILFASIVLIAFSCKKDNDQKPPPPPAASKLAEYKNGEEFIRFQYNADGTVHKATVKSDVTTGGEITDFTISYFDDKKIASMLSSKGEKIVPVYEDNKMIRADRLQGNERTGYTSYYYKNGNLDFVNIYFGGGVSYELIFGFTFKYDNKGNLLENVAFLATGEPGRMDRAGHIAYSHDAKTNPLYAHKDLLSLFWLAVSKNNITEENHFDENLRPEDRFTYAYNYKSNGLPEQATVKQGLPGRPVTTSQVDFIYK